MNNSFLHLSGCLCILFLVLACSSDVHAQRPVVDAQLRQKLVDNIIREIQMKYVAPEKSKVIESALRANFRVEHTTRSSMQRRSTRRCTRRIKRR